MVKPTARSGCERRVVRYEEQGLGCAHGDRRRNKSYGVPSQTTQERILSFFELPQFWLIKGVRREVESASAKNFHHEEGYWQREKSANVESND